MQSDTIWSPRSTRIEQYASGGRVPWALEQQRDLSTAGSERAPAGTHWNRHCASQIHPPSGEKVKHIAYLKTPKSVIRHKVGMHISGGVAHAPPLLHSSADIQRRNKASCQHLL